MDTNERIAELEEKKLEYILNEAVFEDDNPSWGEVAEANAEAESRWDKTDDGRELKALLNPEAVAIELLAETLDTLNNMTTQDFSIGKDKPLRNKIAAFLDAINQ
jgi:hypothetical protein